MKRVFGWILASALASTLMVESASAAASDTGVIEVVTFKLKQGVTPAQFKPIDQQVGKEHVAKQPGFVSRESAAGDNGEWLVIVHWSSVKDAEASMATFEKAPAASKFMSMIDASTLKMTRYQK